MAVAGNAVNSGVRWFMTTRILLIEDDRRLAGMVQDYLGGAGFQVTIAATGTQGIALHKDREFEALILDLMLPDMDGLEICQHIRKSSQVPILMLTARGDVMDRVIGLELGADDYLPKPFEPRELLARIKTILRRGKNGTGSQTLRFGRLEIDISAHSLSIAGKECTLTSYQFSLLVALAQHAGRVLSREVLMDMVKGEALEAYDRSIDVHISRIRAAIEDDAKTPRRIITVRGIGYVFAKEQD